MTNLDSVLKSRDITSPTKICIVKAMVFLVVMYGCEGWTIKKAESWRIDAFEDKVSIGVWIYLWAFYCVPLIYISVFVPVPYCLDDCGFVVEPEW